MVCHDMEVVTDYATRVIVMSGGRVLGSGPTFDVLRDEDLCRRADLIPPQIVDISLSLVHALPHLEDTPIASANTLAEMYDAVRLAAGVVDDNPLAETGEASHE